jgi:hypothetical protein
MNVSREELRLGVAALTLVFVVLLAPSPVAAGDVSVRGGAYTDAEAAFVGIEYRTAVSGRLHVAPNFEIAFPSNGSLFAFSGDLHYVFPSKGKLTGWAGGGLGLYVRDYEGEGQDTSVGANFIGGLGLRDSLEPYLQLKVVVAGDTEVVLGFGIRF